MDWLRDKAARLEAYVKKASLARSLFFYTATGIVAGIVLWILVRNLCGSWFKVFTGQSLADMRVLYWETMYCEDEALNAGVYVLWFLYWFGQYPLIVFCCMAAGWKFLQKKLYPALRAVQEGLGCIAAGDYGKEIAYRTQDEMGILCESFEQLRRRLVEEKRSRWMEQDSQRRINAAFAHDLRTPLTVLYGCTEFLQRYLPEGKVSEEQLLSKLSVMRHQEQRILDLSKTMTQLQKQEAREVSGTWLESGAFADRLGAVARELSEKKGICCQVDFFGMRRNFFADGGLIEEVFDNLISNALRYARSNIHVELFMEGEEFRIYVQDDGKGFSYKALRYGTEPYYSEDKAEGEHFGLGLSISRMLCEKHGGNLRLVNSIDGGGIVAAAFLVAV